MIHLVPQPARPVEAGVPAALPPMGSSSEQGLHERNTTGGGDALREDVERILAGTAVPQYCLQPIGDLVRGVVAGYEVLVRLPMRAPMPPNLCFEAAARCGLRLPLEHLVARQGLALQGRLFRNQFLSVNLSPQYLLSDLWQELLREHDTLGGVVLELTEEHAIDDYAEMRARVGQIKAKGGMLAVDDAGAGYASLKHILELRPSFIKLDRTFVSQCDADPAKAAMIEMMGGVANRMDAWIVAEGIETAGELAQLVRMGVPLGQGYLLGRPVPSLEDLSGRAQQIIRAVHVAQGTADDLAQYTEACPAMISPAEGRALLRTGAEGALLAITDRWQRPVEILERHACLGLRTLPEPMRCQRNSSPVEALERALIRPVATRFDPLVVIDAQGRFVGMARLDRLMAALLPARAPGPAASR